MDFWDDEDTLQERTERFLRSQAMLVVSACLAILSMFLVPPSLDYLGYIDYRTIAILFCFMAVIAGLRKCNVFKVLAQEILSGRKRVRTLCLLLVVLPYLCAMLVTNDVALLAFVPFSVLVLRMAGRQDLIVRVVVLQTVAAILGSMTIPFGNAQNLYVSSTFGVGWGEFFSVMLPISLVGMAVVMVLCLMSGREYVEIGFDDRCRIKHRKLLTVSLVLFCLCILTVLRYIPYQALLVVTLVGIAAIRPKTLLKVDYGLLLTLAFMFIFAGNMAQVEAVRDILSGLMEWSPTLTTLGLSQVISNVSSSVLLSEFTTDWAGLLAGADVGSFGTPIASMASIVAMRLYMKEQHDGPGEYLKHYTLVNMLMLAVLVPVALVIVSRF